MFLINRKKQDKQKHGSLGMAKGGVPSLIDLCFPDDGLIYPRRVPGTERWALYKVSCLLVSEKYTVMKERRCSSMSMFGWNAVFL